MSKFNYLKRVVKIKLFITFLLGGHGKETIYPNERYIETRYNEGIYSGGKLIFTLLSST